MINIEEYILDYQKQAKIWVAINYADKTTVKANNKAVSKMYAILEKVKADYGEDGVHAFAQLLNVSTNGTNLWAAIHLLERTKPDATTIAKALQIIESASKDNLGLQMWLEKFKGQQFKL